jgi:hypothetical protein
MISGEPWFAAYLDLQDLGDPGVPPTVVHAFGHRSDANGGVGPGSILALRSVLSAIELTDADQAVYTLWSWSEWAEHLPACAVGARIRGCTDDDQYGKQANSRFFHERTSSAEKATGSLSQMLLRAGGASLYGLHTRWVSGQKICTKGLVWLALKNACRSKAMTLSGQVEAMSQKHTRKTVQNSTLRTNLLPGELAGLGDL